MTNAARLARWVHDDFGIMPTSMEPIADGLVEADVWCATTTDGATYAVKWSAGGTDAGLLVPAALAGMGYRGVVAPVSTRDDRLWSRRDGSRISVVPWVAGPWAARDTVVELGHRLRERATPPKPVICHADSHGGNVILRGDDDVVLLDWDDAVLAPPERDLLFAMSPSVWFCLGDGDVGVARSGFVDGYGASVLDREVLAYYRCIRAIEDVTELAEWVLNPEGAARDWAVNLLDGVVAPGGQLDVALDDT